VIVCPGNREEKVISIGDPVRPVAKVRLMIWLLLTISLATAWSFHPLHAQEQPSASLPVPSGSTLRATLDGKAAEVKVEDVPKPVEYRFGRKEQGRFVAYTKDQPLPYDKPFMVQIRFSSEPPHDQTTVPLTWENGGHMDILVYKNKSNPTIFESKEHPFEDPSACRGLRFCIEGAEENSWTLER
jgi:hypothetical protein